MAKKKSKEFIDEETGEVINTNETENNTPEEGETEGFDPRKEELRKKFMKISDYRAKANIKEVRYKPQTWINMSDAFKEVTCLPGLPVGALSTCIGRSDTGKSTMLIEIGANALKQGILPILIITENKFSWERAEKIGLYEEFCIVHKGVKTIEEGWERVREHLADLESGVLQKQMGVNDVVFLWDSIGATPSRAEMENSDENFEKLRKIREAEVAGGKVPKDDTKHGGMMVTAKVLREKFTRDLVHKINATREEDCPYNATMFVVNHAYTAPPKPPATMSTLEPYGGDALWLASSLVFRMGGVSSRSSTVTAVKNGTEVAFAIKSALVVAKNHITNVKTTSGKIVCTDHGFILDDPKVIDEYKAKYKSDWDLSFDKYWDTVSVY